jgi:hypothetical protein
LINKFQPKSVGLICVSSPYGTAACNADQIVLLEDNVALQARVTSGITSTDESVQAQAMLGSSLVIDEGFPGPIQLDIETMNNDGLNIPVSAGASVQYSTAGLSPAQLSNLYGYADCVPADYTSKLGKQVESAFMAKLKFPMGGYTAHFFDATMMAAKAAELAKSPSPAKIAKELRTMTYQGICSTYQNLPGGSQILVHQVAIVTPTSNGGWTILKTVKLGVTVG